MATDSGNEGPTIVLSDTQKDLASPRPTEIIDHTKASEPWNLRSGLNRWIRGNITGTLSAETKESVKNHYITLVNVFLRDLPLPQRAVIVQHLSDITHNFLNWDKRKGYTSAAATIHPLFGASIDIHTYSHQAAEIHEGLHVLQHEGYLPFNHALTHAVSQLCDLSSGSETFLADGTGHGGFFKPEFFDQKRYYDLIWQDRADEAFADGWKLNPKDNSDYQDFARFLEKESLIDQNLAVWGEEIEVAQGLKDPYTLSANIGHARAERAYAIGLLSHNMDNAWSILYLHARGMPFAQAEKTVLWLIENNRTGELTNYMPLATDQVERMVSYEEVFGDRKLWELKFPTLLRPLIEKIQCAKDNLVEFYRAYRQSQEKISSQELLKRYEIFSLWWQKKQAPSGIDLSEIREPAEIYAVESINTGLEIATNGFLLPTAADNSRRRLFLVGAKRGFQIKGLPFSVPKHYHRSLQDNLGVFHTHPFYDAPPSIPDLVSLALNDKQFFSIIRSENGLYLVVKPWETAQNYHRSKVKEKFALRKKEIMGNLRTLTQSRVDRERLTLEAAQRLGLEVYQANGPEYSIFMRQNTYTELPRPSYYLQKTPLNE